MYQGFFLYDVEHFNRRTCFIHTRQKYPLVLVDRDWRFYVHSYILYQSNKLVIKLLSVVLS